MNIRDVLVGEEGQMTVELAAMLPVTIVVALLIVNLAKFASACATFDRVALDAVISQGVSPAGEQNVATATGEVEGAIEGALNSAHCEVEVSASSAGGGASGGGIGFPISPLLTTYHCTLRFTPWPNAVSIAGVSFSLPIALTHEREMTVDRFRPGVVV